MRIYWQIFVLRLHQFLFSRTERFFKEKQSSEEEEKEAGALRRGEGEYKAQRWASETSGMAEEEKAGSGESQGSIGLGQRHSCEIAGNSAVGDGRCLGNTRAGYELVSREM